MIKSFFSSFLFLFYLTSQTVLATPGSAPANVDDLISTFSSGCHLGPWTQIALGRAQSLTSTLESLRETTSCRGLENAIAASHLLETEIEKMLQDEDFFQERLWQEIVDDLTTKLTDPNLNSNQQLNLIDNFNYARFELSKARGRVSARSNPQDKNRIGQGLKNVRNHLSVMISDVDKISACYANNPSVKFQIGSQLLSLAGSFAPGLMGLGMQTVATLIDSGISYAQTLPISKAIYKNKKSRMPIALTCGMEAITRDYCRAQDANTVAQLERRTGEIIEPFFYGVDLQENRLPILYKWLDSVVNGVQPVDLDHADRIDEQFRIINKTNSLRRLSEGVLNEAQRKLDRGDSKPRTLKSALIDLITKVFYYNGSYGPEPRMDSPFDEPPVVFIQKTLNGPNPLPSETWDIYLERIDYTGINLIDIQQNLFGPQGFFTERYIEVVREFNKTVNVDDATLVRGATSRDTLESSAVGGLSRTLHFLRRYSFDPRPPIAEQEKFMLDEINQRVDAVTQLLIAPDATNDRDVDPITRLTPAQNVIQTTYNEFKLANNNVFLPGRMNRLIRDDLTNRMCKGEAPKEAREILLHASRDIYALLNQAGLSPYLVQRDTSSARQLSGSTLKSFRDFYSEAIGWAIEDLTEAARLENEPTDGSGPAPNRESLAHLCLLTLISGVDWPKKVDIKLCRGSQIYSKEAKLMLSFNQVETQFKGQPFSKRVCVYEDFLRVDRLAFRLQQNVSELACRKEDHNLQQQRATQNKSQHSFWQSLLP